MLLLNFHNNVAITRTANAIASNRLLTSNALRIAENNGETFDVVGKDLPLRKLGRAFIELT